MRREKQGRARSSRDEKGRAERSTRKLMIPVLLPALPLPVPSCSLLLPALPFSSMLFLVLLCGLKR